MIGAMEEEVVVATAETGAMTEGMAAVETVPVATVVTEDMEEEVAVVAEAVGSFIFITAP